MSFQEGLNEEVVVREVIGFGRELLDKPGSRNAFLGLSLGRSISDRDLAMYLRWALDNCRHCPVLIDDLELRHNYIVFDNKDEGEAGDLVLRRGLALARRVAASVASETYPYREIAYRKANPDDHKGHGIWVQRSSESFGCGLVNDVLGRLTLGYRKNSEFRSDIDAQVEKAMGKRLELWRTQVTEDKYLVGREQLAKFVLEEAAVTVDLVERGYNIELYAGSPIQVIANLYDVATNRYPSLREALNLSGQYGHINLGIARKTSSH